MTPKVNRYLEDKPMDRIDHALGRPLDPLAETYREYYATDRKGDLADEMRGSPHWEEGKRAPPGDMSFFYVTTEGRKALTAHLRAISDPHRAYTVTFEGHASTVVSTTASKARYSHYLALIDALPDLKFPDFQRRSSVRLS